MKYFARLYSVMGDNKKAAPISKNNAELQKGVLYTLYLSLMSDVAVACDFMLAQESLVTYFLCFRSNSPIIAPSLHNY